MSSQPPRRRYERRRRLEASLAIQQELFVRLIAAGVFFLVAALVVVYLYLSAAGPRTSRAVLPVLDRYMRAGEEMDVLAGHSLYASSALRTVHPEDIAAEFAIRDLFVGYESLEATAYQYTPASGDQAAATARISALVSYASAEPADLRADLVLEDGRWRLVSVSIERPGPTPT